MHLNLKAETARGMRPARWRRAMACTLWLAACPIAPVTTVQAADSGSGIDAADYPALTDEELGHLRRIVNLSRQLPGDWSGMSDDLWSVAERTQQFQLSYMAMALALAQHQYTPAYREWYREAMYDLIVKLTNPDIWESWLHSSRAGTAFADPDLPDITKGWIDPIRKHNIMLKGYLLQAGAMYEMLYRDGKFTQPDGFTFRYVPFTWGNGPVTFRYSLIDVAEIVYKEFVDGNYEGVHCEPNRVFPACNQLPILGLLTYDQMYGTQYAADVMPKFSRTWVEKQYTNPEKKWNVRHIFVKQQIREEPGTPVLDGWAGSWMHAWNPELAKTNYAGQREIYLDSFLDGSYARHAPPPGPGAGNRTLVSLGFGQFAFMAAEVGDTEARAALLDYAERNFNPVWENGAYYYPRNDDYAPDADGNSHGIDTWTGNVLLALARLDKGGGFLKLYREPWDEEQLGAPQITGIDDVTTNVSQAIYDTEKGALIVTLKPGPVPAKRVRFAVRNLDRSKSWRVLRDGRLLAEVDTRQQHASRDAQWRDDGALEIDTDLAGPHTFIVASGAGAKP